MSKIQLESGIEKKQSNLEKAHPKKIAINNILYPDETILAQNKMKKKHFSLLHSFTHLNKRQPTV